MTEIQKEHDRLIKIISDACKSHYGELLIECMDYNKAQSTMALTIEGMKAYCKLKGISIE